MTTEGSKGKISIGWAEADLTPEVRQMMEPMLQNMCETMRAGVRVVPLDHAL